MIAAIYPAPQAQHWQHCWSKWPLTSEKEILSEEDLIPINTSTNLRTAIFVVSICSFACVPHPPREDLHTLQRSLQPKPFWKSRQGGISGDKATSTGPTGSCHAFTPAGCCFVLFSQIPEGTKNTLQIRTMHKTGLTQAGATSRQNEFCPCTISTLPMSWVGMLTGSLQISSHLF